MHGGGASDVHGGGASDVHGGGANDMQGVGLVGGAGLLKGYKSTCSPHACMLLLPGN